MHQSSFHIMTRFHKLLLSHFKNKKVKILDVGSYGVNGTYKEIFSDEKRVVYTGLDVNPGPNVDYVPDDPYVWEGLKDESYDAIISGQAFEHIEFPWLIIKEMNKKLKKGGLICIVAPSRGPEHKYPVDCWRYYPDGFRALAKWAGLEVLEAETHWGATGFSDGSDQWGDSFCILHKGNGRGDERKNNADKATVKRKVNRASPLDSAKDDSYYSFARDEVINFIKESSLLTGKVMEIGCAGGATGKKLKDSLPNDYYLGVEISEQAAILARQRLDKVIVTDIEKVSLSAEYEVKKKSFDLIIALDVLEHLYNPWDVLADLKEYLKPGGHVLASIPNVQNVSIVQDLIKGKWRYVDAGILDATHLRFFTLEEIKRMFEGADLKLQKVNHVLNPAIDVSTLQETGNIFEHENIKISDLSREEVHQLFTYQYLIIAEKTLQPDESHKQKAQIKHRDEKLNKQSPKIEADSSLDDKPILGPKIAMKGEVRKGLVSIVILTFNQLEFTKQCVKNIQKHTKESHEIIFVDNASTDGTKKWLRKIIKENPNYHLVENPENLGFAKGCNQGMESSSGEYILLLNNDVIVTENWLSGLLEGLNSETGTGIVGPMTNNISGPQKVPGVDYKDAAQREEYARKFREKNRHRRIESRRIVGFCMLFRHELADKIGGLDESFGSGNFEDDDYCLRAALAGYRNFIVGDVFIHHFGSVTFIGNRIDYGSAMSGNRKIFDQKWGGIDIESSLGKTVLVLNALETAEEFFQKDLVNEAVELLFKAITYKPEHAKAYYDLAEMFMNTKQYAEAYGILSKMPSEAEGVRQQELLAYCNEGMGDYGLAEEQADGILINNPESFYALNLKGALAFKKGERKAAEDFFKKAISVKPGFGDPHTNLGILCWEKNKNKSALDQFEKGFILSPTIIDSVINYHTAVTQMGEFKRAEVLFREAIALHPRNKRLFFLFVDTLLKQGKNGYAMAEIETLLKEFGIDDDLLAAALSVREMIGPHESEQREKGRAKISLCMIVKNEEKYLGKCLASAKPVVYEMIVVDTGSSDKTKEIAKAFGAKVFDFKWINDFSAARNSSLSKAMGDWILVLDGDEVLSSSDYEAFVNQVNKKTEKSVAYSLVTRNYASNVGALGWVANDGAYHEQAGTGWIPSGKIRLFRNDKRIKFKNPVHELVEESIKNAGIEVVESAIPVHHYGSLDGEKTKAKGEKYYFLGKKKLGEKSNNFQAIHELAIQASALGKYDEALDLWHQLLEIKPENPAPTFYCMGHAFFELNQFGEGLKYSQMAFKADPSLREAVVNYASCEFIVGDIKLAISALEKLLVENPDYPPALSLLAILYYINEKEDKGLKFFQELKKKRFNNIPYIEMLKEKIQTAGKSDFVIKIDKLLKVLDKNL